MILIHDISLPLDYKKADLISYAAKEIGKKSDELAYVRLIKRSVDARKKNNIHFKATVEAKTKNEQALLKKYPPNKVSEYKFTSYILPSGTEKNNPPVVIGFGPAGMFAALTLAQAGLKPIVLERGEECEKRILSIEKFHKDRILDENSNVQFGEGGAGTFSDGKLTTGIKDKRIKHVFETFVKFGAPREILWLAKPHIGTDNLRKVVRNIRNEVIRLGGTVKFSTKFTDFSVRNGRINSVEYEQNDKKFEIFTNYVILAIGHSARDTFADLAAKQVQMEQKSFAMGVRIEHLQSEVNRSMYGDFAGHPSLSAADYKFAVHLPSGRTLYTFCMCPGGYVVGAASEKDSVVTNGMSYFARDAVNSNAALLVNTEPKDFGSSDILAGVELQRKIEKAAFVAGGNNYSAPCSLVSDFMNGNVSDSFGKVIPTYKPGVKFARPEEYLPGFICEAMREGIPVIASKADFFGNGEAVMTGAETRSSSPVRILRNDRLCSYSVDGLYPCGEGAGYAGGIVSAAVDGIKCGEAVIENG